MTKEKISLSVRYENLIEDWMAFVVSFSKTNPAIVEKYLDKRDDVITRDIFYMAFDPIYVNMMHESAGSINRVGHKTHVLNTFIFPVEEDAIKFKLLYSEFIKEKE